MNPNPALEKALVRLDEAAAEIRVLESRARQAIENGYDKKGHALALSEKCEILMGLPEDMDEALAGDDGPAAKRVRQAARDFSRRAAQAADIGSIFYMEVLLYPDDYQPGDPNDLERFTASVRQQTAETV